MFYSKTWSEEHDILFLREVLVSDLFLYRKSSIERGKVWDEIADKLNALDYPKFQVNQRYIRDKLNKLVKWYKKKNRDELNESGIDPDLDERSNLLEEIVEKMESTVPINASKTKKLEEDRQTAAGIRQMAMETLGETKKKKSESKEEKPAKKRRSGNEAIEFLKERTKLDYDLRKAELEAKKRNEEAVNNRMEQQEQFQVSLLQLLSQQQKDNARQQEQQQQQNLMMMQQQQSILAYLQKLK